MEMFENRTQAGKLLGEELLKYKGKDTIVLAIPRGGLPVGFEIAKKLSCPLDIIITKKIPHPSNSEYAIGAVGLLDEVFLEEDVIDFYKIPKSYINEQIMELKKAVKAKYSFYKKKPDFENLKDKKVIIVDDGIATGSTMISAVNMVRGLSPKKIIVAVPVASASAIEKLKEIAEETVCLLIPEDLNAVGQFYKDFDQVEDDEAIMYLKEARMWENQKV